MTVDPGGPSEPTGRRGRLRIYLGAAPGVGKTFAMLDEGWRRAQRGTDVVVGYDWHGGYGHPDHVKVHAVTKRAAELAGTPRYLEGSMNRDAMVRGFEAARAADMDVGDWDPSQAMDDGNPLGSAESELHWACDVSDYLTVKRDALKAHASQGDAQGMLSMPEQMFAQGFSREHFIEPGRPDGMVAGWFLDD